MVLVLLAVPLLGGIVAMAYAADLCFTFGSGAPLGLTATTIVLQDVGGGKDGKDMNKDLGKASKCKVVPAFFNNGLLNSGNPIGTATVCTTSAGNAVRVTTNYWGGSIATDFPLPIPTTSGFTDIVSFNQPAPPNPTFNVPTTAAVCVPATRPVP
jgi:hypothetical protein